MSRAALLTILKLAQSYVFQLQLPGPQHSAAVLLASLPLDQETEQNLRDQIEKTAQLLNDLILHRRPPARRDDAAAPDPLLGLSRLIYNQLLPATIQQALREIPTEFPLIIATNDPELPWELAHDDENYLALKYVVARQMLAHQPPRQNVVRRRQRWTSLLIGNPTGDLPETNDEIEQLARLIEAIPGTAPPRILMRRRATKEAVLQELAGGAYDLIHYSGHATFDSQNPDASGLVLTGDELLRATEIEKNLGGQPIVFLNACESARGRARAEEAEGLTYLGLAALGLASAFIRGGAQGFVGAFWPVYDAGSRNFALAFHRSALQGEAIGEALRLARGEVKQAGPMDPLWASFVLYGDPRISLLTVKKTERRPATVLVARLLGLETLFGDVHGEEAAGVVGEHVTALAAQITHYGGQVHTLTHDTLIGTFGIPTTHENDAERAVRAALDMGEAVDQLRQTYGGRSLGLGLGLSSGDVFVGDAGDGDQAIPTVVGEVVNQAVWLARQADDGTILIAELVQRLTSHLFDTSTSLSAGVDRLPLAAPHGPEVLTVYQVLGMKPEPVPPWGMPGRQTAMIGRERELAMLQEAWQMCQQGRGQIAGVVGEAGVGKSRLLYEFRKALGDEGVHWLTAACPSAYSPGPYGLVAQLLRALLGLAPADDEAAVKGKRRPEPAEGMRTTLQRLLGSDFPEQALLESLAILGDILAAPFPEVSLTHLDPKRRQRRLVDILRRLLAQGTPETPLILALEDLHWIDDASLEVLGKLVVRIAQLPILVITLFRSETEWQPPWWNRRNYRLVRLNTLDKAGSRALLAALLEADEAPEDIAGVVLPRTGGNPFFVRELVASLQESEAMSRRNGKWRLARPLDEAELPGTVQRVILTRMEGLPEAAQRVLPITAVAGDDFEYPVLRAVVAETGDESTLDEGLAQLEEREFIYCRWDEEIYHFTHALIQEVAYESLLIEERRRYHRRLGGAMERVYVGREAEVLELLAHHFYRSVTVPGVPGAPDVVIEEADPACLTRAVDYLTRAGARANQRYAARQAIAHYRRALKVAGYLPAGVEARLAERYEGLGDAHNLLSEFDQAIEAYGAAFAELTTGPMRHEERRRAADLARRIGRLYGWKGAYETALKWMREGLRQLGEIEDEDDRAAGALLHIHAGSVHYSQGNHESAAEQCRTGLELAEAANRQPVQAEGYNLLGVICDTQGQTDKALTHYTRSLDIWQRLGDAYQAARVEDNIGTVYFYRGDWDTARTYYTRSQAFWEQIEDQDNLAYACNNLGSIYLHQGDWEQARASFERALDLWKKVQNQRWIAQGHINLGLLYIEQEDWNQAQEHLECSRDLLVRLNVRDLLPETYCGLAQVALGLKKVDEAVELAHKAVTLAAELEMRFEQAIALRALGRVHAARGELAQAEEHLKASLARLEDLHSLYEVGRTLHQLALLEAQVGDKKAAKVHLADAIAIFEEVGAQKDLERAREDANFDNV